MKVSSSAGLNCLWDHIVYLFFSEGFFKSIGANSWICARILRDLLPLVCLQ